ncbi:MAG: hypothetical protein V1779_07785 [bacterium]
MKMIDRKTRETNKSFDIFKKYLQLGERRSLEKLSGESGIPVKSLKNLSKKWDWDTRAKKYDSDNNKTQSKTSNYKQNYQPDFSNNDIEYLYSSVKKTLKLINRKFMISEEQFDKLSFEQMLKNIQNLMKLFNELIKIMKSNKEFSENQNDRFKYNIIEKIQNDEYLYNLADELLIRLAGE